MELLKLLDSKKVPVMPDRLESMAAKIQSKLDRDEHVLKAANTAVTDDGEDVDLSARGEELCSKARKIIRDLQLWKEALTGFLCDNEFELEGSATFLSQAHRELVEAGQKPVAVMLQEVCARAALSMLRDGQACYSKATEKLNRDGDFHH